MNKSLSLIFRAGLACLALVATVLLFQGHGAASLAAFVPLLPSAPFMSRRANINRAIQLDDGTWGPGGELLQYPVYDRLTIANATLQWTLFKNAVNETRNGVVLNFADTNITKSDGVPKSQKWTFWRMYVRYLSTSAKTDAIIQNFLSMVQETVLRFKIESKDEMFTVPLWKFFGADQLLSAPAVTVNSRFPQAVFDGVWELKIPIVLENLTTFSLEVEHLVAPNAALNGDFLAFEFDGERARR